MSKVPVARGTNVRLAGRFNDDNIIAVTDKDEYEALHQCRGDFFEEDGQSNVWWVKIDLDGGTQGWVHAVRVQVGGDDEPIPDVDQRQVEARHVDRWL